MSSRTARAAREAWLVMAIWTSTRSIWRPWSPSRFRSESLLGGGEEGGGGRGGEFLGEGEGRGGGGGGEGKEEGGETRGRREEGEGKAKWRGGEGRGRRGGRKTRGRRKEEVRGTHVPDLDVPISAHTPIPSTNQPCTYSPLNTSSKFVRMSSKSISEAAADGVVYVYSTS